VDWRKYKKIFQLKKGLISKMAVLIDVRDPDWYKQLDKAMEEDRKRDRQAAKEERMKQRGTYKNNSGYKEQYVRQGKIDPIVGYQKKKKNLISVRFSQLSDKEKEDFIAQVKARKENT
jgi:hypothetical protein